MTEDLKMTMVKDLMKVHNNAVDKKISYFWDMYPIYFKSSLVFFCRHTLLYCVLLYCSSQILYFIQIEGLWQPCIQQVYHAIFPTVFAYFVFLCHILVILAIFQTFLLLLYLLWWSVISDLWCYYCKKITTHWSLRW